MPSLTNDDAAPIVFDDAHADVILRSADAVDFPMRKSDLASSSPVFESMFTLPQPVDTQSGDEQKNGLPVVALTEPAATLRELLAFCRLGLQPPLDEYSVAVRVLEAAKKYDVAWAHAAAADALTRLAPTEPLRTYCVACRYGLPRLAAAAARACLRQGLSAIINADADELDWVTARQFRRLLQYVEDCSRTVRSLVETGAWLRNTFPTASDRFWESTCCSGSPVVSNPSSIPGIRMPGTAKPAKWWEVYMKNLATDLRQFPCGETVALKGAYKAFLDDQPCKTCTAAASTAMPRFVDKLKAEVDSLVSMVTLDFQASLF